MTTEQRRDVRRRTFLKGRILFNKGASSLDCLVRDLSETGARLELSQTTALPEAFDLYIAQKETTLRASLRWRREDAVGVGFVDASARPAEPAEPARPAAVASVPADTMAVLLRRIAELEAENAALRSVIAAMGATRAANEA